MKRADSTEIVTIVDGLGDPVRTSPTLLVDETVLSLTIFVNLFIF